MTHFPNAADRFGMEYGFGGQSQQGRAAAAVADNSNNNSKGGIGLRGIQNDRGQQQQSNEGLRRLSEALEEADSLRVSVRSRDAALKAQVG